MSGHVLNRAWWVRYRGEVGYLIGMVGVAVALWGQHQNTDAIRSQSQLGAQTHTAVCAFKIDLEHRVAGSIQFLASHPDGFLGITPKVLEASILNEQKTIHSLSVLRCP